MTEVTEIRCCKHWMQGKLEQADDKCPWCEIDKLQEDDKRGREMTDYDHGYSDGYQQARADMHHDIEPMIDAADTLERLTTELGDLPEAQRELMAENKRLTTERSEDEVLAETDRYRAEVERLTAERDALKADAAKYRWALPILTGSDDKLAYR